MPGGLKRILLVLACGVVLLTACASDDGSGDESAVGAPPSKAAPVRAAQTATGARELVQTATLVVSVTDASRAADRATDLVDEAGGFLAAQESDLEGGPEVRITFKVPPERFRSVLDGLGELGQPLHRSSTTEDVTEQVVDLDGRLASAQASAERLRALIANASIDARFTQQQELEVNGNLPGFLDGLRTGLVALVTGGLVVLTLVGFALPFAPFAVLGWWLWRMYRRRHPRPPRPTPQPQWFYPGAPPSPGGGSGEV